MGSCNTLNDLSNRVGVPNKTENLNLSFFDTITGINESKILTKHISWEWKCTFDSRNSNPNQMWDSDKCQCECKNPKEHHARKKYYILNSATHICKNGKYAGSILGNLVIMYD